MIEFFLLIAAFMVPAALIWSIAFLVFRHSWLKRLALTVICYLAIGYWVGVSSFLLLPMGLPGTATAIALFEWALASDRK